MLRAALLGVVICLGAAGAASACPGPFAHMGVIYDAPPPKSELPPEALVLDVSFEVSDVRRGRQFMRARPMNARVRRVVRGAYAAQSIVVVVGGTSCSVPFQFGTDGLIVVQQRPIFRGGPPVFVAQESVRAR